MAGLLQKFKKSEPTAVPATPAVASASAVPAESNVKPAKKMATKTSDSPAAVIGKTAQAYRILIRPMVTEKAAEMGALGKYVFMVNPKMNKVEVKKAIRSVYGVDPVGVHILNFEGKYVRYGRSFGKRKDWKKAVVTLKPGDKIEIYEGV